MTETAVALLMAVLIARTLSPVRRDPVPPVQAPIVAIEFTGTDTTTTIRMAVVVDGVARVHSVVLPGTAVPVPSLVQTVVTYVTQLQVPVQVKKRAVRLFLVGHDVKGLLGRLEHPTRDARIRQLGADVHHADLVPVPVGDTTWKVTVLDFGAYFLEADTEEVADSIGFPSVGDIAKAAEAQLGSDVALRFAIEGRTVAVVALAFKAFRERLLSRWGVDALRNQTLASLASRIFRDRHLRSGPAPWKKAMSVKKRRTETGFRDDRRSYRAFAGKREVREAAARSLWGGMMIAFMRGLTVRPLVELDVVSLYPHAAIIQPLPYQRTRWRSLRDLDELDRVEGFVRVEFEFPEGFGYPNLPVARDGVNRLVFTRTGVSDTTVAEVRVALRLGARVRVVDSHVFVPGERERNHDLAVYMRAMLADKAAAQKGSIEYEVAKLLANGLIGKLMERFSGSTLLDFERAARRQGFAAGLGSAVATSPVLAEALKRGVEAGPLFAPEWASLPLGMARAIAGDICAKGQVLLVSTDAILVAPGTDLSCPGLAALHAVGSDLRLEHAADAAFIVRARAYALLKRPENVLATDTVFARNDEWCVIRTARHGSQESREEFGETVLACIKAGRDVAPQRVSRRRLGAHEAVRRGRPINSEYEEVHKTTFNWDGKRALVKRHINLFTGETGTVPYHGLGALESAERQTTRAKTKRERKSSRDQARMVRAVLALLADGVAVEDVAVQVGVPIETVRKLAAAMPTGDGGTP